VELNVQPKPFPESAMNNIEILMDYRESNEDLIEELLSNPIVSLRTGILKTGDFLVNDLLLVERKTIIDLVGSIKDGRLFKQAARLASFSKYPMIIIEGNLSDAQSINMKREAIQGALLCLLLRFQIPVIRSLSPQETVKLLILAYKQIMNGINYRRKNPLRPKPYKRNKKTKQQLFILQGLPGIGPVRAKLLLDRFGTLQTVFTAGYSELTETAGIGKYLAKRIISIVNERGNSYYSDFQI
jgi:ERCC4-type nuclease